MKRLARIRWKKAILGLFCFLVLLSLDQWTKRLAVAHLRGQEAYVLWDGVFELRYLENFGAAFSTFQNQRTFFLILTPIAMLLILYIDLFRIPQTRRYLWMDIAAVLFLSGAAGNFIDRLILGYVVDFFYFRLIDFPVFNVADVYVVAAALLLFVLCFFYYKEEDLERIFSGGH